MSGYKYKIRERRDKLHMTQKDLIKKSGISKAELSMLENGYEIDIKLSTLLALADALKCRPMSLVE